MPRGSHHHCIHCKAKGREPCKPDCLYRVYGNLEEFVFQCIQADKIGYSKGAELFGEKLDVFVARYREWLGVTK